MEKSILSKKVTTISPRDGSRRSVLFGFGQVMIENCDMLRTSRDVHPVPARPQIGDSTGVFFVPVTVNCKEVGPMTRHSYRRTAGIHGPGWQLARGRPDYPAASSRGFADTLASAAANSRRPRRGQPASYPPAAASLGATTYAVEPVARDASSSGRGAATATRVVSGTAEAIPLHSASVAAVVCAQRFTVRHEAAGGR